MLHQMQLMFIWLQILECTDTPRHLYTTIFLTQAMKYAIITVNITIFLSELLTSSTASCLDLSICFATLRTLFFPSEFSSSLTSSCLILSCADTTLLLEFHLSFLYVFLSLTALVLCDILHMLVKVTSFFCPTCILHPKRR